MDKEWMLLSKQTTRLDHKYKIPNKALQHNGVVNWFFFKKN